MSDNQKSFLTISNDEYVFSETDNPNQFYFYRKDNQELGDVGRLPMDMYQTYICHKMFAGEIISVVANNLHFETSDDGKCIRITAYEMGNNLNVEPIYIKQDKSLSSKIKTLFKRRK